MNLLLISDLDGTLLDAESYSFQAATEAIDEIRARAISLVLASSKTRVEMEPIRYQLNHHGPFIVENGGAAFIPKGYFPFPLEGAALRGPYQVIELGTPYAMLRSALKEIAQALKGSVRGFGDMSIDEVSKRTGLSHPEAVLAKQREYDEPFIVEGPTSQIEDIHRLAAARGLVCTRGGRFHHLLGPSDKGQACRYLIDCFRRLPTKEAGDVVTIGLGDSLNDLPMLQAVDRTILVQRPDGSYDPDVALPNLVRAGGVGLAGWNAAVLRLFSPRRVA